MASAVIRTPYFAIKSCISVMRSLMTRRHWVRQALRFLSAGRGRTVQSLHFELRAKFRVYFEFRSTEISHAFCANEMEGG